MFTVCGAWVVISDSRIHCFDEPTRENRSYCDAYGFCATLIVWFNDLSSRPALWFMRSVKDNEIIHASRTPTEEISTYFFLNWYLVWEQSGAYIWKFVHYDPRHLITVVEYTDEYPQPATLDMSCCLTSSKIAPFVKYAGGWKRERGGGGHSWNDTEGGECVCARGGGVFFISLWAWARVPERAISGVNSINKLEV